MRRDRYENKQESPIENQMQNKREKKKNRNNEILVMMYLFVGIFVLCIGSFVMFLVKDSRTVINNSYNKRANLLAKTIVRGSILSSDHDKLAYTADNGDGSETRVYPYGNLFTHVVGRFEHTKTGIEANQDFTLLTSSINPIETIYNQLSNKKSIGDNIVTTLDLDLQQVAYDALSNRKGAVVVMEPSSGKILAMVSKPDYDPNTVSEHWESLVEDKEKKSALLNRATQGLYPPGSTFKIVSLLSYMRQYPNFENYSYNCKGQEKFGDSIIHCYHNKVHGTETLMDAFANSCNTAFANIGTKLDIKQYRTVCKELMFNESFPVDFAYKKSSFVLNENSDIVDITQTVIGQGKTLVTPLYGAMLVSGIANGGNVMTPYLVDSIENYHGTVIQKTSPKIFKNIMTSKEAGVLTEYMEAVVKNGTASSLRNSKYSAAGKTGTAEVGANETAHAWFVGFAPADHPEIVVSVIVENAGAGSEYAVPIAKKIFNTYFNNK